MSYAPHFIAYLVRHAVHMDYATFCVVVALTGCLMGVGGVKQLNPILYCMLLLATIGLGLYLSMCTSPQGFFVFIRAIQLLTTHNEGTVMVGALASMLVVFVTFCTIAQNFLVEGRLDIILNILCITTIILHICSW